MNRRERRRQRVLDVFQRYPGVRLYGSDVARMAFVGPVRFYEIVAEMEDAGVLLSDWQDPAAESPRRRFYWLSERSDPFRQVVDDLTGGCGCACHTGIGYNTACDHCSTRIATG